MKRSSIGKSQREQRVNVLPVGYRDPWAEPALALGSIRTATKCSRELTDRNIA